jgi:hypothetical protein
MRATGPLFAQGAAVKTTDGDTAGIAAEVQRSDLQLRHARSSDFGRWDVRENAFKQIREVFFGLEPACAHPSVLGRAVKYGVVQLVLSSVEAKHQFEDSFVDLIGTAVGFVDLVDDYDRLETKGNRLLKHEAGLWHGAFEGIHQQQNTVCKVQNTLHFTTKVAVTRGCQ